MKKYNIINNTLGWIIFAVAAFTYLSTIEPTASYWDCPEFVAQAFKSEVGHPPGNPIFILAGRFAANFAGGDVMKVAKCVNAMSALLSAATILLLFWTITHLVKRLVVRDGEDDKMSLAQYLVVMGSGVCGALAYTWSDTFWFSAVEAEVYAFSSFCTALVFWLILKWENRASELQSDRWIILIAYVFGFSLGVHLLNLLCIPAIALVFYYRNYKHTTVTGSLITLAISFAVIVLILWGLEPGFVELGGYFDYFFVNVLGVPYNVGVVVYAVLTLAAFGWCIYELHRGGSDKAISWSFFLSIFMSGIPFIGESMFIPVVILVALGLYLFRFMKKVPVRIFSNVILSILMIFIGFTCYSLIIVRSNANTPLDENSPNSMFALSGYLSRDQYGKTPLLYGQVYTATTPQYQSDENGRATARMTKGAKQYTRVVKTHAGEPDRYIMKGYNGDLVYPREMCMLFPRVWSAQHTDYYNSYFNVQENPFDNVLATIVVDADGNPDTRFQQSQQLLPRPSFGDNLDFFFGYQLNYMYFRYFMWNFAGRQNDIQGLNGQSGDVTRGNWISGIPAIDNARLGDQSLMPTDYTTGNKGHNVFYCLPLLLGIIGLLWQAFAGKRGIEQFWVVFFLFFMTGIAIVLYLNQPPLQPRERDYAYAGSFYAFAIWIGMGVAGLWRAAVWLLTKGKKAKTENEAAQIDRQASSSTPALAMAVVAAVIGLLVPLQMVSQTWDDHDRSNRYACHDFGMNYLSSVAPNGIIFTNGDNDTFPLWYLQEVEGYRTDVRVVNLSYLATDWYISQMQRAAYQSKPLPMLADPTTYAYDSRQGNLIDGGDTDTKMSVDQALTKDYSDNSDTSDDGHVTGHLPSGNLYIPANVDAAVAAGIIKKSQADQAQSNIDIDLLAAHRGEPTIQLTSSDLMALDIINASIKGGWKRPCYFACTVDNRLYTVYSPYLQNTGMAYQITPLRTQSMGQDPVCNTDTMYRNVTERFRWGGLDQPDAEKKLYLDETVRRMVSTTRSQMINLAGDLANEADTFKLAGDKARAQQRVKMALNVLDLMVKKMPERVCPYSFVIFNDSYISAKMAMSQVYEQLSKTASRPDLHSKAVALLEQDAMRYSQWLKFEASLPEGLGMCDQDRNVCNAFYPQLMMYYKQINAGGYNALLQKLRAHGVNTNQVEYNIKALLRQQQQYQQQSMIEAQRAAAAAVDSTAPQGQNMPGQGGDQDGNSNPLMGLQGMPGGSGEGDDQRQ